ncbi:GNAT family N-acetyltransferase [Actinomadura macrotermitis]|uniref:N-acetyltransferase domain-containing protein n=1 Tax=Actinomadura macrotermitis TaxID=2585200 RepID=A0A7K0BZV9_9ACTN|nr:GNAT family protein [Actinomadura macrotermitis]MQY06382.1 hypothetical protein [Actinomadura macrotermitis]
MNDTFTDPVYLQGPRVVLRPFGLDDAAAYIEVVRAGEDWMPPNFPTDLNAEHLAWWLGQGVNQVHKLGLGIHLAILDGAALVGTIGLFRIDWAQLTCEVGYGLRPAYRGRGYATEALRTVAAWALRDCGLHRMELRAIVANAASIAVAERAGFHLEGRARGAERIAGVSHDQYVFGLLRTDLDVPGAPDGLTPAASGGSTPMTTNKAIAAAGETTLVLHADAAEAARRMLPKLPEVCFAEAPADMRPLVADAAAHGLTQIIVVAPVAALAEQADPADPARVLGEVTADMGGTPELSAAITSQNARGLWEEAGLLGTCGRELCRRVAGVLDGPVAVQVVLVDGPDGKMIGMFGRMSRAG